MPSSVTRYDKPVAPPIANSDDVILLISACADRSVSNKTPYGQSSGDQTADRPTTITETALTSDSAIFIHIPDIYRHRDSQ